MPPILPLLLLALLLVGCAAPAQLGRDDAARIAGRTFVVTGASSGVGRGVALRLASYGGNVVLVARRAAVLDQLAAQINDANGSGNGGQALAVPTDVSRPEEVQRLADAAVSRFGRIDAWINDAAVASLGRFEEIPLADHARVVDVNLKGVIYGSYAALQQFRRQGWGTLVNVASVEGRIPLPFHASYAATKHAIIGLDAAINQELRLGRTNAIRVSTVLPWALDTPFWDHAGNYTGHTPRIATMDAPDPVVDAVVWMTLYPRKEYAVGWKAEGALLGHRALPGLAERVAADLVQRSQMEDAPPAPPTAGAVQAPVPAGTTVEGDTRARMGREDRQRRGNGTAPD